MTRRDFIKQALALSAVSALPSSILAEVEASLSQQLPQNVPVGYVSWAEVNGRSICFISTDHGPKIFEGGIFSKEDYPELFAVIGPQFGKGDDGGTFKLPEFREKEQ